MPKTAFRRDPQDRASSPPPKKLQGCQLGAGPTAGTGAAWRTGLPRTDDGFSSQGELESLLPEPSALPAEGQDGVPRLPPSRADRPIQTGYGGQPAAGPADRTAEVSKR